MEYTIQLNSGGDGGGGHGKYFMTEKCDEFTLEILKTMLEVFASI